MKKDTVAEARLLEPGTYEEVFRDGAAVLLTAKARWPRLGEDCPGLRRIGRYYEEVHQRWKKRWAGPLLSEAKAAAGPETPPWEVSLDFTVAYFEDGYLSLYLDITEDVGARRPRRLRLGDVWTVPEGAAVSLRQFFPEERWWRGKVMEQVRRQTGARIQSGEAIFYENWPQLLSRHFSPQRFYLTPEGPVVFYPMETVGPALEGFPSFVLESPLFPPS